MWDVGCCLFCFGKEQLEKKVSTQYNVLGIIAIVNWHCFFVKQEKKIKHLIVFSLFEPLHCTIQFLLGNGIAEHIIYFAGCCNAYHY